MHLGCLNFGLSRVTLLFVTRASLFLCSDRYPVIALVGDWQTHRDVRRTKLRSMLSTFSRCVLSFLGIQSFSFSIVWTGQVGNVAGGGSLLKQY